MTATTTAAGTSWGHRLMVILVPLALLVLGAAGFWVLMITGPQPATDERADLGPVVETCTIQAVPWRVSLVAFGTVTASHTWTAVAEVPGRITTINDRFNAGEFLPAGETLLTIDPTDLQYTRDRLDAELQDIAAQRGLLEQRRHHLATQRDIAERQVALARTDLARQRELVQTNSASPVQIEQAELTLLSRTQALQDVLYQQATLPDEARRLDAAEARATAERAQIERDLERTRIDVPHLLQVRERLVDTDQYVSRGQTIGHGYLLDDVEITVLVRAPLVPLLLPALPEPVNIEQLVDQGGWQALEDRPAAVEWVGGAGSEPYAGRLVRVGAGPDPATRTVPLVVRVEDPFENIIPGVRPPLMPNAFCRVTLSGRSIPDAIIIPAAAIVDGAVHLVDGNDQLVRRDVTVRVITNDVALIAEGLEPGDRLVLTPIEYPVDGMPLQPRSVDNPATGPSHATAASADAAP